MDKTRLIITETFRSATEEERREALQKAVDQYLLTQLKNGGPPAEPEE